MDHRIISTTDEDYQSVDGKNPLDQHALTFCRYHTRNVIKYFCNTCDETVCRVCTILEHRQHQFVYPKEAIPQQKPVIQELLSQTKTQIPKLKQSLRDISTMKDTLTDCRQTIIDEVNDNAQTKIDELLQCRDALIDDLERIHNSKQKTLSLQSDSVELELGKLTGCCSFAENVLQFGGDVGILRIKSRLQQLNKLSIKLDPEEDDSIQYIREPQSSSPTPLGKICSSQTFASLSYAEGEGLETARAGSETSIIVHAQNRHGKKSSGEDNVQATLIAPDQTKEILNANDNSKWFETSKYFSLVYVLFPEEKRVRNKHPWN